MLNVSGNPCLDSLTRLFVLGKEFIMSEESTNVEEPIVPIVNEEGGQASKEDKQEQPKTFTQSDLDREVDRRLAKQQEKLEQQIQSAIEQGINDGVNERLRTEAPKNGGSNVNDADDPFTQVMNKYK